MSVVSVFVDPFLDYAFLRRALAAAVILAMGAAPLGVFMSLRRMTLVGDALSHAILPGVAVAFLVSGLSLWAMTIGGLVAALMIAALALMLVKWTQLKEDAAFTIIYLLALAVGVTLVSLKGSSANLMHMLFGNILAIDTQTLLLVAGTSCVSLFALAVLYRRLVIEGVDPDFLRIAAPKRWITGWTQPLFFILLMMNLVASFQALGTLMALGLMVLPALAARFWSGNIDGIIPLSIAVGMISGYGGLVFSYHLNVPAGPAIVLVAGAFALFSALIGPVGSVRSKGE